ncbi:hypothetical protein PAEPH01_2761, partial [Pancytospora epiphaga]
GVIYRNHSDISITPQPLRKKCRFYLSTVDGTVTAHRLLNKDRLSLKMFRLVNTNEGLVFCTDEEEYKVFGDSRINIIGIHFFEYYLLLVTEHGHIFKIYLE